MALNTAAPAPRAIPTTLALVIVLVVTALGVGLTAAYFELRGSSSAGTGPTSLTDDLGRHVSVPANPAHVVVLAPSILDSVARLGLLSKVVGVDCDNAAGGLTADYNSSQIAAWGLSSRLCVDVIPSINTEDLLNKSPDLVIASTLSPVGNLEEASVTYHLPLVFLAPTTVGGILVDVTLLGQMLDATNAAAGLVAHLEAPLGVANNLSANLTSSGAALPTVMLTYYATPASSPNPGYFVYGPDTFGQSLLELAGGASISASAATPYPELTGSQVLASDPQVIIYGTGFGLDLSTYQSGPDWSSFAAVSSGHVYGLDSNFITEPGPSMILVGLPLLVHLLHPTFATG